MLSKKMKLSFCLVKWLKDEVWVANDQNELLVWIYTQSRLKSDFLDWLVYVIILNFLDNWKENDPCNLIFI